MISSVYTAPCVGTSSTTGWSAIDSARMLARRYHDERCQKRLAAASASVCVASRRSSWAAHAGTAAAVGQSAWMSDRLNASVLGQRAFEPKPSASRWYGVSRSEEPSPEKTVRIVTVWPSSRRLAMRPPQERATSSGCGATKTWVMAGRVYRAAAAGRRSGGHHAVGRWGRSPGRDEPFACRVPALDGNGDSSQNGEARDRDHDDGRGDRCQRRERQSRVIPLRRGPEDRDRQPAGALATAQDEGDDRDRDQPGEGGGGQTAVGLGLEHGREVAEPGDVGSPRQERGGHEKQHAGDRD